MTLKRLLEENAVSLAQLPAKNAVDIATLDRLEGYTVPLIAHDYAAKTPLMWNTVYEHLGLPLRNIMVVADPKKAEYVLNTLRNDPKYLGGGAGVGFKEAVLPYLDRIHDDADAVNIIVNEQGRLVGYNTDAAGLRMSVEEELATLGKSVKGGNFVVFGAGGVAKQFVKELAKAGAHRIGIINRTVKKATQLAEHISQQYSTEVYSAPEDLTRGVVLNTLRPIDAVINTTDKGSDGPLEKYSAFAPIGEFNNTYSIDVLRLLKHWNPNAVIVDIVLPKSGRSTTLRHAQSAGFEHLVDGIPMVTYQAIPAYLLVQKAHLDKHSKEISPEELTRVLTAL